MTSVIQWDMTNQTYYNPNNSMYPIVMFGNSATGQFGYVKEPGGFVPTPFAWRSWQTVDVGIFDLPDDVRWIEIDGIPIITGNAQITFAFRPSPNSLVQDWGWYQGQLLSTAPTDGERSSEGDTIAIYNRTFQYCVNAKYYPDNGQDLPYGGSGPAVGWNFKIKKWGRQHNYIEGYGG